MTTLTMRSSAIVQQPVEFIWHQSENLAGCDAIILPGGFAYGDYLRTGAIARFSPVMKAVERFARGGGLVLGICNGFQILLEAGLLPGAMMRNKGLRFLCQQVHMRVESDGHAVHMRRDARASAENSHRAQWREIIFAMPGRSAELERNKQIIFRYVTAGRRRCG